MLLEEDTYATKAPTSAITASLLQGFVAIATKDVHGCYPVNLLMQQARPEDVVEVHRRYIQRASIRSDLLVFVQDHADSVQSTSMPTPLSVLGVQQLTYGNESISKVIKIYIKANTKP
jgi:hypothetical protein